MSGARIPFRWHGQYRGYGKPAPGDVPAFCSLRCCERFAALAYRDGVRVTQKKHVGHLLRLRP